MWIRAWDQLPDVLATLLIPGEFGDEMFAVKATDNGDCHYNVTYIALYGNESLSCLLRLLVTGELFFNANYYAEHPIFKKSCGDAGCPVDTLFSTERSFSETQDKCETVKVQALSTCCAGEWSSLLNILALASVISRPIFSLYPDVNFPFRKLFHRVVMPRPTKGNDSELAVNKVNILWSRVGGLTRDYVSGSSNLQT